MINEAAVEYSVWQVEEKIWWCFIQMPDRWVRVYARENVRHRSVSSQKFVPFYH